MLTAYRYAELAGIELAEATAYYDVEANKGLAFVDEIERVIGLAMEFPDSGTLVRQTRVSWPIYKYRVNPEFPYDLGAMIVEEQGLLLVLAVAHHKRRPGYWIGRAAEAMP